MKNVVEGGDFTPIPRCAGTSPVKGEGIWGRIASSYEGNALLGRLINNGAGRRNQNGVRLASALVPVTGAALDSDMVRLACELLESRRSALHILYVIEVPRHTPVDAVIPEGIRDGERALESMEEIARRYNGVVEAEIIQARRAGPAVVREAVEREVDAIVAGVSASNVYGRYSFDASVSYILRHAPCRVILARDAMDDAAGLSARQFNAIG